MSDETTPPGVITVGGLTMTTAQDQIAAALAKAQARVRKARKNARNPHLRNEYADLESVIDATRGALAENGLALVQAPQVVEGAAGVRWTLVHASGQWMSGELMHATGGAKGLRPAQADGVSISYARRYTLASLLGVAVGDDSDGAVEVAGRDRRSGRVIDRRETHPKVWASFVEDLAGVNLTVEEVDAFLAARGRPRCHETPDDRWGALVAWATTPETAAKVHA
ncbi:MAG: ERF family protein [Ilumatobacteraceae bacterium]